ncbi:MAG: cell division protein FtsL [bacterium]|nr:cell division protein FtsL [bacterium]
MKIVLIYLIFAIIVISIILGNIWQHNQIIFLGYRKAELVKDIRELENERNELKIEISRLSSFSRIEKVAHKLGLITPQKIEVIRIPMEVDNEN